MSANDRNDEIDVKALLQELVIDVSHIREELEVWRSEAVYPGCGCFYYDAEQNTWVDAVFHQWCTTLMPPNAIVHSLETGKCFLVKIEDLRFHTAGE